MHIYIFNGSTMLLRRLASLHVKQIIITKIKATVGDMRYAKRACLFRLYTLKSFPCHITAADYFVFFVATSGALFFSILAASSAFILAMRCCTSFSNSSFSDGR